MKIKQYIRKNKKIIKLGGRIMGYTDILKEPQEMMNTLFDKQELEIKRLTGIIMNLKASSYFESPEKIVEKVRRIKL